MTLAVEWLETGRSSTKLDPDEVRVKKTHLRVSEELAEALGTPAYVRVGVDTEVSCIVLEPAESVFPRASFTRYKGSRYYQVSSSKILRAIEQKLGWGADTTLKGQMQGKHLICRLPKKRRRTPAELAAEFGVSGPETNL